MGEFGLIDRLNKMIADARINKASPNLILGIGDDAAAWQGDSSIQLATVDTMIQGVHFTLDTATWQRSRLEVFSYQLKRHRRDGRVAALRYW